MTYRVGSIWLVLLLRAIWIGNQIYTGEMFRQCTDLWATKGIMGLRPDYQLLHTWEPDGIVHDEYAKQQLLSVGTSLHVSRCRFFSFELTVSDDSLSVLWSWPSSTQLGALSVRHGMPNQSHGFDLAHPTGPGPVIIACSQRRLRLPKNGPSQTNMEKWTNINFDDFPHVFWKLTSNLHLHSRDVLWSIDVVLPLQEYCRVGRYTYKSQVLDNLLCNWVKQYLGDA